AAQSLAGLVELLPAGEKAGELQNEDRRVNLPEAHGGDGGAVELAALHLRDHRRFVALLAVPEEVEIERVLFAFGRFLAVGEFGALAQRALPRLEDLAPGTLAGSERADFDRLGSFRFGFPLFVGFSLGAGRPDPKNRQDERCRDLSKHEGSPSLLHDVT